MQPKFYRCNVCSNVIIKLNDSGVAVECCGEPMEELIPKTTDQWKEKHVPVVTRIDECTIKVEVGSVYHPMTPDHYIQWIYVETEHGGQIIHLNPTDKPCVTFCCRKCKPIAVYEYCNIHGLWKVDL